MHLNNLRINFFICAHYEKDVGHNKEIIKKYHIIKHQNCLHVFVNTESSGRCEPVPLTKCSTEKGAELKWYMFTVKSVLMH